MATLDSVTIHRFRHVEPGTTLRFRTGLNVLLGRNATGKTTLLELIAAAFSLDFTEFAREPFALAFVLTHGDLAVNGVAENVRPSTGSEGLASVANIPAPETLIPQAELTIRRGSQVLVRFRARGAQGEREIQGLAPSEKVAINGPLMEQNLLFGMLSSITPDESAWINRMWPTIGGLFRFPPVTRLDESLEFLKRVLFSAKVRATVDRNGQVGGWGMLAPPQLTAAVIDAVRANSDVSTVPIWNAPFLGAVAQTLGFRIAAVHADRTEKSTPDQNGNWYADYSNFRFEFTRFDGSVIDHKKLSYGQSRMLAFHYWLATFDGIAVSDELVNGLHHAWITSCVDALARRQSFLTTQNPLLLDYLRFDSEQDVADSFIVCESVAPEGGPESLRWANINERNAHAFYRAYTAGIQHVSEILTARGLW